ncbi:MAG: YeeE/YedE thiosulfate transporter family protein [Acidocella sp.]|nr:YeeE/YedE thiosulfate transporter family protein [Acidocella sp.]
MPGLVIMAPMPGRGFLGGLMIGLAGVVMLLGNGRIAGVSGMAARVMGLAGGAPRVLAAAFIMGLPLGAGLVVLVSGGVATRFPASTGLLVLGGVLVGFGTRLGSGCTSGHGVCGLSRLSIRSMVATAGFMASGVVTVAAMRLLGVAW